MPRAKSEQSKAASRVEANKAKAREGESKSDAEDTREGSAATEAKIEETREAKMPEVKDMDAPEKPEAPKVEYALLNDLNTQAENAATPGRFARVDKWDGEGDREGQVVVIIEDVPDSEDVIVRQHNTANDRFSVPYSDLRPFDPYGVLIPTNAA
jgi:biotin carboxyl carrier protein